MQFSFDKLKLFFLSMTVFLCLFSAASGQTTAFTYQGRLTGSSVPQPTSGNYDLLFKIFDANGVQQGGRLCSKTVLW
jgi:hypothetical protein